MELVATLELRVAFCKFLHRVDEVEEIFSQIAACTHISFLRARSHMLGVFMLLEVR